MCAFWEVMEDMVSALSAVLLMKGLKDYIVQSIFVLCRMIKLHVASGIAQVWDYTILLLSLCT